MMGNIRGITASVNALYAAGFFARFSYALARSPVLPLFALYLGAGPEAIGLTVGISTVTGIFFKLPSGALSDVIGRRKTMLVGLMVFALAPFGYLAVTDYRLLIVVRFFHGFATAIYSPVAMAMVADIAGAKKGEALSWFSSVTIIGTLLGAPVGGFLLHAAAQDGPGLADFRTVYILSGISGVIALLIALIRLRDKVERVDKSAGLKESLRRLMEGIREVISDRRVLITANMEGLQNMTVGALEAFLPIYAVSVAGLNAFEAGMLWGIQVFVTILSKPVMGKISDRYGRKPLITAGMLLCALSFGAIPLLSDFYHLMFAAIFFGFGEAFVTSSAAALVVDISKEKHFGTAMGAFGTIFDIGHASGPMLAGVLIARFGFLHSFWMLSAVLLLATPVFIAGVSEKNRPLD